MHSLWASEDAGRWRAALDRYESVIEDQGVARLPELDRWYREDLPRLLGKRRPAFIPLAELVRLTEWKMARGVWRAPNLARVRRNPDALVQERSREALAAIPHQTAPIRILSSLDGVGPATASALAAAAAPEEYPFFDELVAAEVPSLGPVKWTLACYSLYADALRLRSGRLGTGWTPALVARAVWAEIGGKAGTKP